MSTSGTYTYNINQSDIVREAILNLGKLGEGEGPTPQEYTDCIRKLNLIIKQLQGSSDFSTGLKQWTRRVGYLFLSNSTGQYTLSPTSNWTNSYISTTTIYNVPAGATSINLASIVGINNGDKVGVELDSGELYWTTINGIPSGNTIVISVGLPSSSSANNQVFTYTTGAQFPVDIDYVLLRDNNNQDTEIKLLNIQDWAILPSKADPTNTGDPIAVYVENQLGYGILRTDVGAAQDVSKVIVIGYLESIQDASGVSTETLEYPQEYLRALSWLLTREICPMFNGIWTPLMSELTKEAVRLATNKDPETSTMYFQPNT